MFGILSFICFLNGVFIISVFLAKQIGSPWGLAILPGLIICMVIHEILKIKKNKGY